MDKQIRNRIIILVIINLIAFGIGFCIGEATKYEPSINKEKTAYDILKEGNERFNK